MTLQNSFASACTLISLWCESNIVFRSVRRSQNHGRFFASGISNPRSLSRPKIVCHRSTDIGSRIYFPAKFVFAPPSIVDFQQFKRSSKQVRSRFRAKTYFRIILLSPLVFRQNTIVFSWKIPSSMPYLSCTVMNLWNIQMMQYFCYSMFSSIRPIN